MDQQLEKPKSRDLLISFYRRNIAEMRQKLQQAMTPQRQDELRKRIVENQVQLKRLSDMIVELGVINVNMDRSG